MKHFFALTLIVLPCLVWAQPRGVSFGLQTPFIDPVEITRTLDFGDQLMTFAKAEGRVGGESVYTVQWWDKQPLQQQWEAQLGLPKGAFPIGFHAGEQAAMVWVHAFDRKSDQVVIQQHILDTEGNWKSPVDLVMLPVLEWKDGTSKGQVAAHLQGVVESGNGGVPLEQQVTLRYSPDGSKVLLFQYDYSKSNLYVNTLVFDKAGELLHRGVLPINRGRISYDLLVNNRGEVLLLETSTGGTIAAVLYNMEERKGTFLEVPPGNNLRTQFQVEFLNDDEVYVANLDETEEHKLEGVLYTHFNFAEHRVEEIVYLEIPEALKAEYDSLHRERRGEVAAWSHFDLVGFKAEAGHKYLFLEKRNYRAPGFYYDALATMSPDLFATRRGHLESSDVLVLAFDRSDEFAWGQSVFKDQEMPAGAGLRQVGIDWWVDESSVSVFFQEGLGRNYSVHLKTFDANTGQLVRDRAWTSLRDWRFVRGFTHWSDSGFYAAGYAHQNGKAALYYYFSY